MIRRENISGWGILSQAILRSLAIRVVVSIFESHHGSEENPSDPIELFRSLLHQRTAIRRLWDQVRLVHLGRVWKARFRAVFEARRVSRNSPCAKQRANVHVVALTASSFSKIGASSNRHDRARNHGLHQRICAWQKR